MGLIGERGGRSGLLPATQRWSHLQRTDSSAAESQADLQSAGGCWRSAREGEKKPKTKIRKPSVLFHCGVGLKPAAISAFVASGGSRTQLRLSSRCCESQFGDIAACRRPPVLRVFSPKSLPRHLSASSATALRHHQGGRSDTCAPLVAPKSARNLQKDPVRWVKEQRFETVFQYLQDFFIFFFNEKHEGVLG